MACREIGWGERHTFPILYHANMGGWLRGKPVMYVGDGHMSCALLGDGKPQQYGNVLVACERRTWGTFKDLDAWSSLIRVSID